MDDDAFDLWIRQVAQQRPFRYQLLNAVNRAGILKRNGGKRTHQFNGSRIGRGSATGRILGEFSRYSGARSRRVAVNTRIAYMAGKGARAATAHLRYLQRDGTTRGGERGTLYSADHDSADGKAFLKRSADDRHQFRIIVSAEDGAEYQDLKPMIRRLLAQAESDLATRLDWVAADHFNTGHPHSHILIRGRDDHGKDLIIASEYLTKGLVGRATDIVNIDLGPRTDLEIARANLREMDQERFTSIDCRLQQSIETDGLVSPHHRDPVEQSLRAGRLATLERLGLAVGEHRGRWRLSDDLELTLCAMGKRSEIIATLDREVRTRGLAASPADYAIYDPARPQSGPIVGRIAARGLQDDESGREYLILDGIDGHAHYVEIGSGGGEHGREGAIVRISPSPVAVRDVDRTISEIAAANGERYSEEIHLFHDPTASERFVQNHIRRLETIRRSSDAVELASDGSWRIAPDYVERVLEVDRQRADRESVRIEPLTTIALEQMPHHDGITWLDEDPSLSNPRGPGGSFGSKVADAMQRRQQWLVEQGLGDKTDMLEILRRRELQRISGEISRELGVGYVEAESGFRIEGTCRRSVQVGMARMALIENAHHFTLVPWHPGLERQIGREVSGMMRGNDLSWTFGRQRSGPEL